MNNIKDMILSGAGRINAEIIGFRRHFHMNPELSFEEYKTSAFICAFLDGNGISYRKNSGTGIIGEIKGSLPGGRIIALRAEMDALPVEERNDTPYKSKNSGCMHACGHDAHMAMLMGTALLLNSLKEKFAGTILLIFQPAEELAPGGARLMIESGAFNDPRPEIVLAQHVLPELVTGKVGYKAGKYMASSDEIYLTVKGKGGHAALPGASTDQICIASRLVIALKDTIAAKQKEIEIPTVLGIGRIRGDGATNVIPEKVEIAGTFRTFDEKWRAEAKDIIRKVALDIATESGVTIDVRIVEGYPVLINDEKLTSRAIALSSELLGKNNVETFQIRMSSEDFAFFTESFPSLYLRAGIRKSGTVMKNLHTPDFDIDEEGLVTGVANMCWLAVNFLRDN